MKTYLLAAISILICLPMTILGLLLHPKSGDYSRPWNNGFIRNTLLALRRYPAISWMRRIKGITKNPVLGEQYLKLMFSKFRVHELPDIVTIELNTLIASHDVNTEHPHHRQRVAKLTIGDMSALISSSRIVVVGRCIQDGHHRIAAAKEAGLKSIEVLRYLRIQG